MEMLLCTNSASPRQPALEYGVWLAGLLKLPIVLLGIVEKSKVRREIEDWIDETSHRLIQLGVTCRSLIVEGSAESVIAREATRRECLAVVGFLDRSKWRRLWLGSSHRRLMNTVEAPLLCVPSARLQLHRILLCTGGLRYAEGVTRVVRQIAQASHAKVTLLHVTGPASLHYPPADELQDPRRDILESSSPQAHHVRRTLAEFEDAGIPIEMKRRHGYIIREIIAETNDVDYDMVGLGSPHGIRTLRHLFTPNVTAEVLEAVNLPVLVARYEHQGR